MDGQFQMTDMGNMTSEHRDDETEYLFHDIICESSEPSVKKSLHLLTFPLVTVSWDNLFYGIGEEI